MSQFKYNSKSAAVAALVVVALMLVCYHLMNYHGVYVLGDGFQKVTKIQEKETIEEVTVERDEESEEHLKTLEDKEDWNSVLRFLPKSEKSCNNLFKNFSYPEHLSSRFSLFQAIAKEARKKVKFDEGHIGTLLQQQQLYYHLSKMKFARTICEIGFNYGHSAFFWLQSSPTSTLYSFDLGSHGYVRAMASYMKKQYQDRFHIYYGDSIQTIPAFTKTHPGFKCDVLSIDGGHTYKVAKADLMNMRQLANKYRNIVVFDDYPAHNYNYYNYLGKAWNEMIKNKYIESLLECEFSSKKRGFSVGHYIF